MRGLRRLGEEAIEEARSSVDSHKTVSDGADTTFCVGRVF